MADVPSNSPWEAGSTQENAWISDLLDQHSGPAWTLALRLVGQVADAEEVLQEAFLKVLKKARKRPIDKPRAYLNAVVKTTALDLLARRKAEQAAQMATENVQNHEQTDPFTSLEGQELANRLDRAIAQLDPRLAKVITARYLNQQSYDQIAQDMGISRNTARIYHWRAMQRLREIFSQE